MPALLAVTLLMVMLFLDNELSRIDGLIIASGGRFIRKLPGIEHSYLPCGGVDVTAQIRDRLAEMQGGTFTISNGGIFGSMNSTPILNPPQSGILGMHSITERAVVVDGEIVVRPMMYLALSYDHRLIDGQEAVRYLVSIKGMIEDPARILLEL